MPINQEMAIREILSSFTDGQLRVSRYSFETNFSYRISRISVEYFEYTVFYQDGSSFKSEKQRARFKKGFNFNELIVVMRKHSNKCLYCGGNFKGLIYKTCKMCGKSKNY